MRLWGGEAGLGRRGRGKKGAEEEKRNNESLRGSRGIESGEKKEKKGEEEREKGNWKGRKEGERELKRRKEEGIEGGKGEK
jgi:hypothetical protein